MTAEIVLVILLLIGTMLAACVGAVVLAAFGPTGWFVLLALLVTGALIWRFALARIDWQNDDLRDDWRAG